MAGVAQLVGASFCNRNVVGSIPIWDTYLGCGLIPCLGNRVREFPCPDAYDPCSDSWSGHVGEAAYQCFSLTLIVSLCHSSFSKKQWEEKNILGEDLKKENIYFVYMVDCSFQK